MNKYEIQEALDGALSIQLGQKISIAGVEIFKVEYEVPTDTTLVQLDRLKEQTGLTARIQSLEVMTDTDLFSTSETGCYGEPLFAVSDVDVNLLGDYIHY